MNSINSPENRPATQSENPDATQVAPMRLPIDPVTFLIGLWRRRTWFLVAVLASFVLAILVALQVGSKVYVARATLLYQPPPLEGTDELGYSLHTLVDMVKSPDNIGRIREKLRLHATLGAIGKSFSVELRRKTTLIEVAATWDDPKAAADMANMLCETFLGSLRELKQAQLNAEADGLQRRLEEVAVKLAKADSDLQNFMTKNNLIDPDKEADWYFQQLTSLNTLYDEALSKSQSLKQQRHDIDRILDDLKKRAAKEQQSQSSQMESTTEANVKIQRLRELISETRDKKAREADLLVREEDLKRAKKLYQLEAISKSEYERIVALYKRAKALVEESPEIVSWQRQIKELDKAVVPQSGEPTTSGKLLQEMMTKVFDIELRQIAIDEEVRYLDKARKDVRKRLDLLPMFRRDLVEKNRAVGLLEEEDKKIRDQIGDVERKLSTDELPFEVVMRAVPPKYPKKSNRKLLFLATFVFGCGFGFFSIIGLELRDRTIRSTGDLKTHLPSPLQLTVPDPKGGVPISEAQFDERLRLFTAALRRHCPGEHAVVVVTSATPEPGVDQVALSLATTLEMAERRVLLFDAHVRQTEADRAVPTNGTNFPFAPAVTLVRPALPIDRFLTDTGVGFDEVVARTDLPNLDVTEPPSESLLPEVLKLERMRSFFEMAKRFYSLIVIHAPSINDRVEIDYLSELADAAVLVVSAEKNSISVERKAIKRLEEARLPLAATVLMGVRKPYR